MYNSTINYTNSNLPIEKAPDILNLLLDTLCIILNIFAIIGIFKSHKNTYATETVSLLVFCLSQLFASIIDGLTLYKIYEQDLLVNIMLLHLNFESFLLFAVSCNRVNIIRLTFKYKRNTNKNRNMNLLDRYLKITILCAFLLLFNIFIFLPSLFFKDVKNLYNFIYLLIFKACLSLFVNFLLISNYLFVIPYYLMRFNSNKITLKNQRSLVIVVIRLALYSFFNVISFSFYSIYILVGLFDKTLEGTHISSLLLTASSIGFSLEPVVLILVNQSIKKGLRTFFAKLKKSII